MFLSFLGKDVEEVLPMDIPVCNNQSDQCGLTEKLKPSRAYRRSDPWVIYFSRRTNLKKEKLRQENLNRYMR
jgi:hypothetical protein